MVDLDYPEDSEAGVDGNFVMTGGRLVEVQMSAEGSTFSRDELGTLVALAGDACDGLAEVQRAAAGG